MEIKIIEVSGFKGTLTALRKPFKGQIRTDLDNINTMNPEINEDDYKLLKKLIKAGDSHAKCIRGINVTLDVTAPRFFWSEHDTYKVGVNPLSSESTMHTLLMEDVDEGCFDSGTNKLVINAFIHGLDSLKGLLLDDLIGKPEAINIIKKDLPEGFLQTRTIQYNYQALRRIYFQRKSHRLHHWKEFCRFIETLPMNELITLK